MPRKLLQLLPSSVARKQADAWRELESQLSEIDRIVNSASRTASTPDRAEDRLVPQVFAAKILGSSSQAPVGGKAWWTYTWEEVERAATGGTWNTVSNGRNSTRSGVAWNSYETTIANDGGNIIPATPTRLAYPTNAVVEMIIDPAGRAWFENPNPVEIC
jgi:hypothetical protein